VSDVTTASAPPPTRGARAEVLARLRTPGAGRWYIGSGFGLLYQVIMVVSVWTYSPGSLALRIVSTLVLLVLYTAFVVIPPLVWPEAVRTRVLSVLVWWAASCVLFVLVGMTTVWVWPLLVVLIGFVRMPRGLALGLVVAVVAGQVVVALANGWPDAISFAPYVTLSVGISMVAFGGLIQRNVELRAAHDEIARLAVNEERARLARDLHDSLGHSLTVVAVKSELARKLVPRDPAKAEAELADIEQLARDGLRDLRAAVAGYRAVDLDAELTSAKTALDAAGIVAHVPAGIDGVRPDLLGLFAWVVREGVTNVVRHSGARSCWIELGPASLSVRDDGGSGRASEDPTPGNGLRGLRERADAAGATLACGPVAGGGFELRVSA
jgi:two-component system, NarL family, sensor histidine kinase DesK